MPRRAGSSGLLERSRRQRKRRGQLKESRKATNQTSKEKQHGRNG